MHSNSTRNCNAPTSNMSTPKPPPAAGKHVIVAELRRQQPIALPLVAMNLAWFAKTVITTGFLGRLGELELAGGALGFTFANVTGFSVLTGLCGAMEPICGQAFGAKNYALMRKSLVMATVLLLVVSVPVALLWISLDDILPRFGQQRDIVALAKVYATWLIPDLAVTSFLSPLKAYLSSQGEALPILACSAAALVFHVPINLWLSNAKGIRGVAAATCITDLVTAIMLGAYVFWVERTKQTDGWWREHKASDWARLLRLAGPCCLTTCLEWWCYEILVLLTGHLPDAKRTLSVLAIVLNFDYLLFSVMLSLSTCASVRVSNELGGGNSLVARTAAYVSVGIGVVIGCFGGSSMALSGGGWGRLFSRDRDVVHGARKAMVVMAVIEVVNFPLTVCGGIVRGTARPQLGMYATLGGFYLVALPVGVVLGFGFGLGLGLNGLLLGFLAGALTSLIGLVCLIGRVDWAKEARKARVLVGEGVEGNGEKEILPL